MNAPELATLIMLPDGVKKITEKPETKFHNASLFVIEREDHTMGNLIRMRLLENPKVHYAGYRIPHPLKLCIEVRIQTVSPEYKPRQALIDALSSIKDTYRSLQDQFEDQLKQEREKSMMAGNFNQRNMNY